MSLWNESIGVRHDLSGYMMMGDSIVVRSLPRGAVVDVVAFSRVVAGSR